MSLSRLVVRLAEEAPFRSFVRPLLPLFSPALATRIRWDLSERPAYLLGLGTAAQRAVAQGLPAITAIEFGVAGGAGLLVLEREAVTIGRELGIRIDVVGFDAGDGLPRTTGDYRDHPDFWQLGDFPMDEEALRARLKPTTRLILGDVRETVHVFDPAAPLGFISFDLDLYSSTADALSLLSMPDVPRMRQVACYFDDIMPFIAHDQAGELLAIHEFNEAHRGRYVISRWAGVTHKQVFPERSYLSRMFVCHDLEQISATVLRRERRWLDIA